MYRRIEGCKWCGKFNHSDENCYFKNEGKYKKVDQEVRRPARSPTRTKVIYIERNKRSRTPQRNITRRSKTPEKSVTYRRDYTPEIRKTPEKITRKITFQKKPIECSQFLKPTKICTDICFRCSKSQGKKQFLGTCLKQIRKNIATPPAEWIDEQKRQNKNSETKTKEKEDNDDIKFLTEMPAAIRTIKKKPEINQYLKCNDCLKWEMRLQEQLKIKDVLVKEIYDLRAEMNSYKTLYNLSQKQNLPNLLIR